MLYPLERRGRVGFVDRQGVLRIPHRFAASWSFEDEGGFAAVLHDGLWGTIDRDGEWLTPPRYASVLPGDLMAAKPPGGMWGFADALDWKVEPRFAWNFVMNEGYAAVQEVAGGKMGFVDASGQLVVPCRYDQKISVVSEGLGSIEQDGRYGFVNMQGEEVIPCTWGYADTFSSGRAPVRLDDLAQWGMIDRAGELVIGPEIAGHGLIEGPVGGFYGGDLASVQLGGKQGYIDLHGELVIEPRFDVAWEFSEGRGRVAMGDTPDAWRYGFIDRAGEWIVPARYTGADPFHRGLARVELDGVQGYIDRDGNEVVPPRE